MNKFTRIIGLAAIAAVATKLTKMVFNKSDVTQTDKANSPATKKAASKPADSIKKTSNKTSKNTSKKKAPKKQNPDFSDSRTQKMYKDLGMTQEQKERYQNDYAKILDEWELNNPGKTPDDSEKIKQTDSALNAVLNEDQYGMYREWSKKNPS